MAGPRRHARHLSATSAFRPSAAAATDARTPSRTQTVALLCGLVLVAAGIAAVSYLIKPARARSFSMFYGSVYIDDNTSPVSVDLASGKPTVRLTNAFTAVSAKAGNDIDVYPLDGGNTLLLDPASGEFNMVDSTGFVVKSSDGGVPLPKAGASTTSMAVPSGSSAYIVRRAPDATSVYLVGAETVSAAVGSQSGTKARAYATLTQPLSGDVVPAADAGGSLWVLTKAAGRLRQITQLSVPAGSNAGVTLAAAKHGTVSGPAAVASATRNADGSGGSVAAVASSDSIAVFRGATRTDVPVSVGSRVDRILPASNAQGTLVFLYHSRSGWSQVSVPAAAGALARVTALKAVPADANLVTPAQSVDHTYTMDTSGQGTLWQIDPVGTAQAIPGAASYPLKKAERPQFDAAQVLADGARVIFNSRANLRAEVVFSDGSHAPRAIYKHSAVQVDPSGATALASAHAKNTKAQQGKTPKPVKAPKQPTQTINDKINCKVAKQVPRVPTLVAGDRAARSIGLSWIYQRLDPSDCYPSTYVIDIKVLTSDAPSPPSGQVTVQGQSGVTLTHLFPATEYEFTVTAYINTEHTTSAPIRVTTGPEGPAAPTGVTASADGSGNWTVSWNSCGGIAQGCVPSVSWYLIPSFCDGRGVSAVPAKVTVPGDPTQHSFTHVYAGGDSLLGRAMCFQIQGVSPQGTIGTTSAESAPAFSWTSPDAAAMRLSASQPANTSFGGSTTTTVDLDLGANPIRDVGGVGATIDVRLSGPDGAQTKSTVWDGRSDRVSEVFSGIKAGAQYTASATVAPPRHASDAVTVGPATVTTRAQWPALSAQAVCPTGNGPVTLSCTLSVQMHGLASADAGGERFDLTQSSLACGGGNSATGLTKNGFDPSTDPITASVDLLKYNGTCTVTLQLVEAGRTSGPLVFGGTVSPVVTESVDLGRASALGAGQGDFTATFDPSQPNVTIHYNGDHDAAGKLTLDWHEQVYAPDRTPCGTGTAQPDVTIALQPYEQCSETQGDQSGWTFDISYRDLRDGSIHSFTGIAIPGKPSGFVPPCVLHSSNFSAQWTGDYDAPSITVTFDSSGADTGGCSGFSYTVYEPLRTQRCGSADEGDTPPASDSLSTLSCQNDLTLPGNWQVEIGYSSARQGASSIDVFVQGDPPAPPTPTPTPTPTPSPTPSPT